MATAGLDLAAIVLAAGSGTRFSAEPGGKLLAALDGRPLLEHVLIAVRAFGPVETLVVLGAGADIVERSIPWAEERRVVNREPERGIGSSIQVGFRALEGEASIEGAFIVLGDQPRLRRDVLDALAGQASRSGRPILVPRYADEPGPRNPVLLMRRAWPLVDGLVGDAGLGRLVAARPGLIETVTVPGTMPDVDEPRDLATMADGRSEVDDGAARSA
jgi:CTP:molybdopterin cytidylyltransferase MocA